METIQRMLQDGDVLGPDYSLRSTVLALMLAFVIGQAIAWVYSWTHAGLSYARSFTQSLVLLTMVVSLVMFVIGDSIVTAFGLIGALAIIRFRNVLKDTRDTCFVFFALVLGMAVGSQRYMTAIVGTVALLAATLYLRITSFGHRGHFDGHLSLQLLGLDPHTGPVRDVLQRFCRTLKEISLRRGGDGGVADVVWQVRLRDRSRSEELLTALRGVSGVGEASLVLRDELAEI